MGVHEIICLSNQKSRTVRSRMPKYGTFVHLNLKGIHVRKWFSVISSDI